MAITKTVIKLTHQEAIVKVVNDSTAASVTIGVATDLLRSDETLSGTIDVRLSRVEFGAAAGGRIVRNTINVLEIPAGDGAFEYTGFNDGTQGAQDLVVTIGQGTLFIRLLKVNGYKPNFQPEQKGGY